MQKRWSPTAASRSVQYCVYVRRHPLHILITNMFIPIGQACSRPCREVEWIMELARHMALMEEADWTFHERENWESSPCIALDLQISHSATSLCTLAQRQERGRASRHPVGTAGMDTSTDFPY